MAHTCANKVLTHLSAPRKEDVIVDFGSFGTVLRGQDCPVCRTLAHLLHQQQVPDRLQRWAPAGWEHARCTVRLPEVREGTGADGGIDYCLVPWEDLPSNDFWNLGVTLYRVDDGDHRAYVDKIVNASPTFQIRPGGIEHSTADPNAKIFMRKHSTSDGTINLVLLKSWIEDFKELHRACRKGAKTQLPRGFRLVDVVDRCMVDDATAAPYAALSYVWGAPYGWSTARSDNIDALKRKGGLTHLPPTIVDAMDMTRKLELRYLWVDSLCILQDNVTDKFEQLARMGDIFKAAHIVLVAAYGNDASAGLPGVRPHQFPWRCSRRRENLNDHVRLLSVQTGPFIYDGAWKMTAWNTRGWTYQEGRLSHTQLIFTNEQAYLACTCGQASSEENALNVHHFCTARASRVQAMADHTMARMAWQGECSWNAWLDVVQDYHARRLTYPEDILHAVSAVMKELQHAWGMEMILGMPVYKIGEALLWAHRHRDGERPRRRDIPVSFRCDGHIIDRVIPSWSWAGWIGELKLPHHHSHHPAWEKDKQTGKCAKMDREFVESWNVKNHPIYHTLLEATPFTAYFDIGPLEDVDEAEKRNSPPMHPIYGKEGTVVGHLIVPICNGSDNRTNCEFIELSGRRLLYHEWDYRRSMIETAGGKVKIIDIMLVRRLQGDLAERVGVAYMHEEDWDAAKPLRKKISLC